MTVAHRAAVAAALALLAMAPAASASPGDLDPSFGGDGVVTAAPGDDAGLAALALHGETIVGAGSVRTGDCAEAAVARWSAGGSLLGVSAPATGDCTDSSRHAGGAAALALLPGGGALTGGTLATFAPSYSSGGLLTAHAPAGGFDTAFSGDGWLRDGFGGAGISAVVRLPDGRVVAGGNRYGIGRFNWEVRRYLADGRPDDTFGQDGAAVYPWILAGHVERLAALVADGTDGTVVAAGTAARHAEHDEQVHLDGATIGRILPNGALDPAFGNGGRTRIEPPGEETNALDLVRTSDGGFVVAGTAWPAGGAFETDGSWLLLKFDAAGTLDETFGAGGRVDGPAGWAASVALDSEERIVVLGRGADGEVAVARYLLNGAADESFGTGGVARTGTSFWPGDVVVQGDDRVVAGGTDDDAMTLVRLLGGDGDESAPPPEGEGDGEATGDGEIGGADQDGPVVVGPVPNRQGSGGDVTIRILRSRVSRRGVLVRITYPRGTEGTARARLWTRNKGVLLGQRRVVVLKGTTSRRFRIPLNRRAKRMLKGGRRLKVRATVRVTGLPARR